MSQNPITEFPFPSNLEDTRYRLFPEELEQDGLILFHGTPLETLASINEVGFQLPDPNGDNPLTGVSFARHSMSAFTHAMNKRKTHSGDYCVIAVKYASLDYPHICPDGIDIVHDYKLDPQPQRIGFCTIPVSYQFV